MAKTTNETVERLVKFYLSSRGWGDFCPVEITVDYEIDPQDYLAQAREVINSSHDVDFPNQTDEELLEKLKKAVELKTGKDAAKKAEKAAYDAKVKNATEGISSCVTTETETIDEDGVRKMYLHEVTCLDGEVLSFKERNIFDFGVVVNPAYKITDDATKEGGLESLKDGIRVWQDFNPGTGWYTVRPLSSNEIDALNYIYTCGKYASSSIRM